MTTETTTSGEDSTTPRNGWPTSYHEFYGRGGRVSVDVTTRGLTLSVGGRTVMFDNAATLEALAAVVDLAAKAARDFYTQRGVAFAAR